MKNIELKAPARLCWCALHMQQWTTALTVTSTYEKYFRVISLHIVDYLRKFEFSEWLCSPTTRDLHVCGSLWPFHAGEGEEKVAIEQKKNLWESFADVEFSASRLADEVGSSGMPVWAALSVIPQRKTFNVAAVIFNFSLCDASENVAQFPAMHHRSLPCQKKKLLKFIWALT